jgi:hypothetical protein
MHLVIAVSIIEIDAAKTQATPVNRHPCTKK